MRQEREKITENGAKNQTGGGSIKTSEKKSKTLLPYLVTGLVLALIIYLILK